MKTIKNELSSNIRDYYEDGIEEEEWIFPLKKVI